VAVHRYAEGLIGEGAAVPARRRGRPALVIAAAVGKILNSMRALLRRSTVIAPASLSQRR
jgi:hypothetical protein